MMGKPAKSIWESGIFLTETRPGPPPTSGLINAICMESYLTSPFWPPRVRRRFYHFSRNFLSKNCPGSLGKSTLPPHFGYMGFGNSTSPPTVATWGAASFSALSDAKIRKNAWRHSVLAKPAPARAFRERSGARPFFGPVCVFVCTGARPA